jgi:hypothetical protein
VVLVNFRQHGDGPLLRGEVLRTIGHSRGSFNDGALGRA